MRNPSPPLNIPYKERQSVPSPNRRGLGRGEDPQTWRVGGAKTNSFPTETEVNQTPENNEFLLDYTGEALDLIYSLTSGQPYLVQLIGFYLVRRYNDQVFEQGRSRDNTFTVEDIEAVINQKFFQQGRYYFEGVWGQAAQGATGQQEIIKALAPHLQGFNKENLASTTNLDTETFAAAIETLKRHDVIAEKDGIYYIIVELFRRWVLMR
ncbi:MAG: hypothetical protein QNJ34_09775 [Xenococcaceae cyanobacterium MO_188.B29]|nr:hypothetical protein [Xenococcaceae cyanobacterium MO_188.B29]